jgi:hypothetical protein
VASGSGPGAFLSEILKKNPVPGESGPMPGNFEECLATAVLALLSRAIGCEHSNPQRTKASAAGAVAETPQNDGASEEGATPKRQRCAGPMWAAIGKLVFRWDGEMLWGRRRGNGTIVAVAN